MRKLIKRWWLDLKLIAMRHHKTTGRAVFSTHIIYYGLVSVEAHGNYKFAAAACACLLIWEGLAGKGGEA